MRPERLAELRDVAEDALSWVKDTENAQYRIEEAGIPDPDGVRVLARAIPELLDELETLRADLNRGECEECGKPAYCALFWGDKADYPLCVDHFKTYIAKWDGQTREVHAKVAMLRKVLERCVAQFADESANAFGHARIQTDMNRLVVAERAKQVLADTKEKYDP